MLQCVIIIIIIIIIIIEESIKIGPDVLLGLKTKK